MVFERKYKGASEFLRASKRAAPRPTRDAFAADAEDDGGAGFDSAVMGALMKAEGNADDVARAINTSLSTVESAIERLLEQGFVELAAPGTPLKLTEAGRRYLKYSQLTKF